MVRIRYIKFIGAIMLISIGAISIHFYDQYIDGIYCIIVAFIVAIWPEGGDNDKPDCFDISDMD